MIRPLHDNIIFQFLNETDTVLGKFKETTSFGLEIIGGNTDDSAKKARWALVTFVGPDVTDVEPGNYIYISPLKWTEHFRYEGMKYWKTDIDQILLVSDDLPDINI
jgi:hypothetical protein